MLVFGESLFGVRMLMVLAGLITAWVYYLISKKWWGNHEAGIAALVFGIVSTSSFYTLVGRMDAIAILSYSLLLLLHIVAVRQEKKWPHFLVGVVAILTTEFHILGLMYVGALAAYYGIRYLQIVKRERKLVLNESPIYYFIGAGLAGVIYIIVHILPDPEAYFLIPTTCKICELNPIQTEISRIKKLLVYRPHELFLAVLIFYSIIRRYKQNQHFLILLGGCLISQIIISPPPYTQYFHHLVPLLAVGLGRFSLHILSIKTVDHHNIIKNTFLIASLILLILNLMLFAPKKFPYENAYRMPETAEIEYIQEYIPKSMVVMADANYFYPLKEYRNFLHYGVNLLYGLSIRGESYPNFLDRIDPEVINLSPGRIEDDPILKQFIEARDFVQVLPDLWVARELVPSE
jgi:4-amino-4-deoxy-L-arabinose transferase-like glycosyltransferase